MYFEHCRNEFAADKDHSRSQADHVTHTAAYSRLGRMRTNSAYFIAFPQRCKRLCRAFTDKTGNARACDWWGKANGKGLGEQV